MSVTFKTKITKCGNIKLPEELAGILGTEPGDEVIVTLKYANFAGESDTGLTIPLELLREADFDFTAPLAVSVGEKFITIEEMEDYDYE